MYIRFHVTMDSSICRIFGIQQILIQNVNNESKREEACSKLEYTFALLFWWSESFPVWIESDIYIDFSDYMPEWSSLHKDVVSS
jgi:hypothetical protein